MAGPDKTVSCLRPADHGDVNKFHADTFRTVDRPAFCFSRLRRRATAGTFARVKIAVALALLLCAMGGPAFHARAAPVEQMSFGGKAYLRLDQWARANGFTYRVQGKNVTLVNGTRRLTFAADSKRTNIAVPDASK